MAKKDKNDEGKGARKVPNLTKVGEKESPLKLVGKRKDVTEGNMKTYSGVPGAIGSK